METYTSTSETVETTKFTPKNIKSVDVRRLKRQGHTPTSIADMLGVSPATVYYHLKKRASRTTTAPAVKPEVAASVDAAFEVNIYGVEIKLQRRPTSIEQRNNAIIIS